MKRYRHYKQDKAIVLSCFGSIIEQEKYLKLKDTIQKEFKGIDIFLSFSSRMVLKHLAKKDIIYKNLPQVLADVDMQGFRNIIVSSINLFPTDEHSVLKNIVNGFDSFSPSNIRYTKAILSKTKETTIFLKQLNDQITKNDTANLYIIHGTPLFETTGVEAIGYSDNFLQKLSDRNYTCSLEGAYPYYAMKDILIKQMKKDKVKKLQIVPLLLVSGNHYIKDMVEIKDDFDKFFDTSIVESQTKSDKFNLIEFDTIIEIIKQNIQEEIIKLGQ
jgi:sirohydrochlorin cobaltochelatase